MTSLDLYTVMLFAIILQVSIVVARVCVQNFSKTYPGFGYWTLASLVQVVGFGLLAMRRETYPNASFIAAMLLLILITPLHVEGTWRFFKPSEVRHRALTRVAAGIWLVFYATIYGMGATSGTLIAAHAASIIFFSAIALLILAFSQERKRLSAIWLLGGCAAATLAHQLFRFSGAVFDDDLRSTLASEVGFSWVSLISTTLTVTLAIAQITVNAQRVTADLEQASRDLELIASTDALTGSLTRRSFYEEAQAKLDLARRHHRPLAFLMCDLDHFKSVNDRFGHAMGDKVLSVVGATLRDVGRSGDRVSRLGGEEFGVLLAETGDAAALVVAERVRQAIADLPPFPDGPLSLTISVGVAVFNPATDELATLIDRADRALYQAKDAGRNRWVAL